MKNTIIYIILLVSTILLGISNYYTYHKLQSSLNESRDYKFKYNLVQDSLGREHAQYQVPSQQLNELNSMDKSLLENTAKSLGTKPSNIKSVTQVSASTSGNFSVKPLFTDGHLTLHFNSDTGGSYNYTDTCWFTTYTEAKRFLGIKYGTNTLGDIHFGNPDTKITGLNTVSIDKYIRPKHWVVVIGPSYGLTPYGLTYGINITLGYKLLEL